MPTLVLNEKTLEKMRRERRQKIAQTLGLRVNASWDSISAAIVEDLTTHSTSDREHFLDLHDQMVGLRTNDRTRRITYEVMPYDTIEYIAASLVELVRPRCYAYAVFNGVELIAGGATTPDELVAHYHREAKKAA